MSRPLRIGVDATAWQNQRGYGRHARALLNALVRRDTTNRYTFIMDSTEGAASVPLRAEVRLVETSQPASSAASASGSRSPFDMWRVGRALSSRDFDALLFPTIYTYVPVWSRASKLVMVHDIIAETYPRLTTPGARARIFWNAKVALGRRQADAVVTVSEFSRRGIIQHFRMRPERVFVVGEASDPAFCVLPAPSLPPSLLALGINSQHQLVTYVGGFNPHKNLDTLIKAFARIAASPGCGGARLVMVGEYRKEVFHSYFGQLSALVEQLGLKDRVLFPGFVPDEDLAQLLNLSSVLVLPSLMEGYGLPAIEAAACGCPVIATTASPLPELLGAGGVFIEPTENNLTAALNQVLSSAERRAEMRRAGIEAARRLTWDAAARQMLSVLHKVVTT